eukprot:12917072-Prorocentrum_lima.AAC.1
MMVLASYIAPLPVVKNIRTAAYRSRPPLWRRGLHATRVGEASNRGPTRLQNPALITLPDPETHAVLAGRILAHGRRSDATRTEQTSASSRSALGLHLPA